MIRTTCHTVDGALTVEFDAAPWFREADPASIVHVAGQGWSSAWIADGLEKRPGYERLHELIDYARNRLGQESLEDRANPPVSWSADKLCDRPATASADPALRAHVRPGLRAAEGGRHQAGPAVH